MEHEHNHEHELPVADKYVQAINESNVTTDDLQVKNSVEKLLAEHLDENRSESVYSFMFNCIDLTTLNSTDSERSVAAFTRRVNDFGVVRQTLEVSEVNIAVCSANFPSSQAHLEVKCAETALAVADGADEVDIVFNLGYFADGAYEDLCDEISEIKEAAGDARLKVILETGALKTAENIRAASILSMYSGADFIKTSTGKIYPGASLEAAWVMCQCIKEYYERHGRMVGFKVSGGVRTTEDALKYYTIVKEVLGEKWLTNEYFRIGASSLANNLFADITGSKVDVF